LMAAYFFFVCFRKLRTIFWGSYLDLEQLRGLDGFRDSGHVTKARPLSRIL